MKTKKIKKAPGWLELNEEKTGFVYLDDRAKIVQRIFKMSISGIGGYTIAKVLNEAGVPAFGTSGAWDQSTIHNMLGSRATIGEYQKKQKINGAEVPVGEPIPHYYPAVIDLTTFEAAQETRRANLATRRGRKGRHITNLFSDIPRCMYCDSTVKLHNAKVKSLVCKKVWSRQGCYPFKWTYVDFEKALLEQLLALDPSSQPHLESLLQAPSENDQVVHQARLAATQHIRSIVESMKVAFAGRQPDPPSSDVIRRDHPDRFFELKLSNGKEHIGKPAIRKVGARQVDPLRICEQLGLSQRQGLISARLADGEALNTIAKEIGMSISTARWHLREIFKRTNCHSQAELIQLAKDVALST
jgi:DNA-binding CsgD family transcriptional regulator